MDENVDEREGGGGRKGWVLRGRRGWLERFEASLDRFVSKADRAALSRDMISQRISRLNYSTESMRRAPNSTSGEGRPRLSSRRVDDYASRNREGDQMKRIRNRSTWDLSKSPVESLR